MDLSRDMAVLLVVLAPFVGAALAPYVHRLFGASTGWVLALIPAGVFAFLWQFVDAVARGEVVAAALRWGPAHGIDLSFFIDGVSLTFALTISGIGAFILIYSGAYLKGHAHQGRFFTFMMLFMGAMLGLVLADSGVVLYLFWELTTVASFLLIGFDHMRQAARRAAIQAVAVTGIGGLALLAGAILLERLTGSWELSAINAAGNLGEHPAYLVVLVLILVAAFTKSAQVPFHFWLPNAMEAPTPVSAYLHSATMVQGGVYLLMRLSPSLGGTDAWSTTLLVFGGATMLWGAVMALRQTDLKQMLAQTTIASLGLLVFLIGLGSKLAIVAAVVYFLAHALYKAGLFLVTGNLDHEAGTRDITALGGLREKLAGTFIAALLLGASMVGFPLLLGYFAKDEMYLALNTGVPLDAVLMIVLIAGNGLLGAVGFALALRPFMGPYLAPPKSPHEAPIGMLAGPIVFGVLGAGSIFVAVWLADSLVAPATAAITGVQSEVRLHTQIDPTSIILWLSVLTWLVAAIVFWQLDAIRTLLRRAQSSWDWTFDRGFDTAMFGLIRAAGALTRALHHGRLELYMVVVFVALAAALLVPHWLVGGLPSLPAFPVLQFYEWAVLVLAVTGVATVVLATTRLFAILALGIQGLAVALVFLLFGAPDLSFTQVMVEILSVVIFALVMTRLQLERNDVRPLPALLRDSAIALACGVGLVLLLMAVLNQPFDPRLSDFFNAASVPLAHGRNVVNVILVDFRGLDTLGEIAVVMTAGVAIVALIRGAKGKVR